MTTQLPESKTPPLSDVALFFDVDGTLVEIESEPHAVVVTSRLRELLRQIIDGTAGAMALISGRSIEQLDRLFVPLGFSASGLHGLERRLLPGEMARAVVDRERLTAVRRELDAFARKFEGILVEDKGLTLALHYRMAPQHREAAADMVRGLLRDHKDMLVLLEGKMVFELKPPGFDKGRAIADFMQEPPFRGRCPIFAGDDVTDEAGFAVVNGMKGISIKVGAEERPTAATHGVETVDEVLNWLDGLVRRASVVPGDRA